jgi:hypothetical protein
MHLETNKDTDKQYRFKGNNFHNPIKGINYIKWNPTSTSLEIANIYGLWTLTLEFELQKCTGIEKTYTTQEIRSLMTMHKFSVTTQERL